MNVTKILVPTDFSECARGALESAYSLAERFDAEVLLCHVMEVPVYPAVTFAGAPTLPVGHDEIAAACDKSLAKLVAQVPEGVRARSLRREGVPYRVINAVAKEEAVDLIVISTHGYTGLTHFMMGSTAERVVRTAPCAVLTVRGAEA